MPRLKTKICSVQLEIKKSLAHSNLFCIKLLSYFIYVCINNIISQPSPCIGILKYTK